MKKFFLFILVLAITYHLSPITCLHAESFKILGSRPLGMGGAFVAVAEDTLAQYWNPAGLAKQKLFDLQAPMSFGAKFTGGILKEAKDISDIATEIGKIQTAQGSGEKIDQKAILNFYKTLSNINDLNKPGLGALIELPASLAIRIGRTSWQLNNFTEVGVTPSVDLQKIGLGAPKLQTSALTLKQASTMNSPSSFGAITFSTTTLGGYLSNPTSTELTTSRNQLTEVITELQNAFGVKIDTTSFGVSLDEAKKLIANALINIALDPQLGNMTTAQVILTTQEIKEYSQELANILTAGNFTSFQNNQTKLTLHGASILEVSAAYGQPLFFKDLLAGVNFKVMRGYIGFGEVKIMSGESTDLNSMLTDYTENVKASYNFGVDLGLLLDKKESWRTRIGLLARNINRPSFEQPAAAGGKYYLDPQVRAGVAFFPLKGFLGWLIAADYDLTKNSTLVEGYESQLLSVGTEINLGGKTWFNVAARAGAMKNLAQDDELTYTAGLGMNFLHFQFDLAGAISADKTEIKAGEEFPSNAQVSATLTLNF